MAMNSVPSASPASKIGTTFEWSSEAASFDSRRNRARNSLSSASDGGEQLQRHLALQPRVVGEVDDTHPAPAEQPLDPVAGELRADPGIRANAHPACTVTQTPPSPTATWSGRGPTSMVASTVFVAGSIRETVPSL